MTNYAYLRVSHIESLTKTSLDTQERTIKSYAKSNGFHTINLDVRATQDRAIHSFETLGFSKIGTHPNYALIEGKYVAGYYFTKQI